MKKFHVNNTGNFNIYGEIIPIGAFYGKIGDKLYYYCQTSHAQIESIRKNVPLVDGILPLPVYIWEGELKGWVLQWDWGKIAHTIYTHAQKYNAWNDGVKKDMLYGMGKTIAEKRQFIETVNRKDRTKYVKEGSKYAAKHRHKNVGEIPLSYGECIISRTFNTMNTYK